jgi:hypothetical protein
MRVFLDTEFTDLDAPQLLSIGLVDELGRTFYAEIDGFELAACSPFVWTNVLPLFTGPAFSFQEVATLVRRWLADAGEECQVVTDAPEYDFDLLKWLLGDDWPSNLAKQAQRFDAYTTWQHADVYARARQAAYRPGWPEHHALADAIALQASWKAVKEAES